MSSSGQAVSPSSSHNKLPSQAQQLPPTQSQKQQQQQQQKSQQHGYVSTEERLSKIWRSLASGVAVDIFPKAEKVATTPETHPQLAQLKKDLDHSVIQNFFKLRMEYHRLISHVEAKLQGKAQEREALETYVRTQPRLGKRKRA